MIKALTNPLAVTTNGVSLFKRIANAVALNGQRNRLAKLDNAALQDMGIERGAALSESRRPVWDAPAHWRG